MIRGLAALVGAALLAGPASAHSPFPGIGTFYNGMLHPLLVPAQLLALVGVGLVIGQHAPGSSRIALPVFVLLLAGALAVPAAVLPAIPPVVLVAVALLAGILVALSLDPGTYGAAAFAAGVGLLVGSAARLDAAANGSPGAALAGTALGAVLVVVLVGGLVAGFRRPWQRIGVRVLGSWTAASAFLVLTLSLAGPGES